MHRKILEDLTKDCPCRDAQWCFLKELVLSSGFSDRQAEQIRLVYDYKDMTSKAREYDIGRETAFEEFIFKYGKRFAEVYRDGMTHEELFKQVFQIELSPTPAI